MGLPSPLSAFASRVALAVAALSGRLDHASPSSTGRERKSPRRARAALKTLAPLMGAFASWPDGANPLWAADIIRRGARQLAASGLGSFPEAIGADIPERLRQLDGQIFSAAAAAWRGASISCAQEMAGAHLAWLRARQSSPTCGEMAQAAGDMLAMDRRDGAPERSEWVRGLALAAAANPGSILHARRAPYATGRAAAPPFSLNVEDHAELARIAGDAGAALAKLGPQRALGAPLHLLGAWDACMAWPWPAGSADRRGLDMVLPRGLLTDSRPGSALGKRAPSLGRDAGWRDAIFLRAGHKMPLDADLSWLMAGAESRALADAIGEPSRPQAARHSPRRL